MFDVIKKYKTILSDPRPGTIPREIAEMKIELLDDSRVYTPPYKLGEKETKFMEKSTAKLAKDGFVVPSSSPFSSPGFAVPKKNEKGEVTEMRPVYDYRKLNKITKPDKYPIPPPEDCISKMAQAKFFTKFDLKSAYWQILIRKVDAWKTAFSFGSKFWEWLVTPYGLINAPPVFQRAHDNAMLGMILPLHFLMMVQYIPIPGKTILSM